eukprot:m.44410 g.44410  ORF g.44410 m.44410 type:complete len:217 (+) comp33519_c0_seq3:55-705(+)
MENPKFNFKERDSAGFKFTRKSRRSRPLSPRSKRRKSCEFFAKRQSFTTEPADFTHQPMANEEEKTTCTTESLIDDIRRGAQFFAERTEELAKEERDWDHLIGQQRQETEEILHKDWSKEVVGEDGLPKALNADERTLLSGSLPLQDVVDRVNGTSKEVEQMIYALDIEISKVKKIEKTSEALLNEEMKSISNELKAPHTPKTAIQGLLKSGSLNS